MPRSFVPMSYGAFLLLSGLPLKAHAALEPKQVQEPLGDCVDVPGGVLCPAGTFRLFMDALSTYRAEVKICGLQRDQLRLDLAACSKKVEELSAKLPCPELKKPDPAKAVWGYALGVISAASVAAAAILPVPVEARAGLAVGGLAGLGLGVVLVLP